MRVEKLGNLVSITGGGTPDRSNPSFWGGDVPWVTVKDFKSLEITGATEHITTAGLEGSASNLIAAGAIIVPTRMALGKAAINMKPVAINQDLKALRIVDPMVVDRDYLFRYLLSKSEYLESQGKGATVKGITLDVLRGLDIPLPPKKEQQRIATVLGKADGLRRKRQEAIRLADEFLRAVFIDMFGDPGSNPKNFEVGTIRDLVASANYGTSEKASEEVGKYAILRMNNITYQGGWDFSSLKYVDLEPATAHKFLTQRGDLLFNRTNSKELVGKTAVYMRDEPMAIAGYLVRVRMNERGNPHYVSGYLNSTHGKQTLTSRAKSIVGMANINAQEMQDIPLLLPPIELQNKYARIVEAVHARLETHQAFLRESVALHSALSHKFFGPVNAEEAETC